jgi:hypothetical protein
MDPILAEVGVVAGERGAVELDLLLPMGTIRGRVQSPAGLPRAHTTVLARAPENGSWRTVTDAAGAFELRVPAEPPSYELCVLDLAPVPVTVNTDGVELVTPGYGRIRLRAWEANHAVVERVTLYVRRTRPEWASAGEVSAGTNGLAEWELEAGALELAAGKPEDGYPSTFLGGFTLAEDAELELQVLIERVEPVEFVLGNAPLPARCAIGLEAANGLLIQGGTLGAGSTLSLSLREGRASVPGLASDTYRLIASLPDVVVEPAEIRLGADRSRPIELTWHRSD